MRRKLTITIDEEVYEGLHRTIGRRRISRFVETLVRPHVLQPDLEQAYVDVARDERRETGAIEWAEDTLGDGFDAPMNRTPGPSLRLGNGERVERAARLESGQ